jgi:hypothetical protein
MIPITLAETNETDSGERVGLGEWVSDHREDLEELAEKDYPISPVVKTLLTRVERGDI